VLPRQNECLFSNLTVEGQRLKWKDSQGDVKNEALGLRLSTSPFSYIERETLAAYAAKRKGLGGDNFE